MAIQPIPDPPAGDYVINFGDDTPENRAEAERILRNNGCQRFRVETAVAMDSDARPIRVHGYLGAA